eukprot:CCRYP_006131-RA/>CCRYP_006131-RA protein AED:0.31 eAED:0.31 QI:0/0/0/1/1/1/2/0/326
MNGSWGRSYKGVYSSFCRDYDNLLSSTYSNVLFIVSAGNTGIGGIPSIIQNPSDCKNTFAVGATLSYGKYIRSREKGIEYLADYSSRGPTSNGRIKPNIVAPGHFILAPNAGVGARYVSGTSMSSPVVAASASIVRQYFEEGWCNTMSCCGTKGCGVTIKPSGSLLKAILINGAQPLTGGVQSIPGSFHDNNQGIGQLNLLNSLPLSEVNNVGLILINDRKIVNGAEHEYIINVDTSNGCTSDLRVTLAWYDAPGAVGCTHCVMNDLDLFIEDMHGSEMFYPNGLSYRNKKNTAERIRVPTLTEDFFTHLYCNADYICIPLTDCTV